MQHQQLNQSDNIELPLLVGALPIISENLVGWSSPWLHPPIQDGYPLTTAWETGALAEHVQ